MISQVEDDINKKIAVEQNIIQGANNLKQKTSNSMVIQKCNTNIREALQNIEYLQETLKKIRLNDESKNNENDKTHELGKNTEYGYLSTISPNEHIFSRLDLIKYDCPSMSQRIQYMLQQLEFKLQVEKQYQDANAKLTKLYQIDGDRRSSSAAEGGQIESKHRIIMLKKALRKYQAINIDLGHYKHNDADVMTNQQPKFRRKPLTGILKISINGIRDVDHIQSPMFARSPDSFVEIKIDDTVKARTKLSRTDRWNEEFQINIAKGNEIEFTVYDRINNTTTPVAIMWMLVSDIAEEIRKKKTAITNGQGWVSASNVGNATNDTTLATHSSGGAEPSSSSNVVSDSTTLANQTVKSGDTSQITATQWYIMEPTGQMLLTLGFTKSSGPVRANAVGGLHRNGAIINRNEEVFEQHGHHFVQKSFYNIMCCAYCGEFLRYTGFQCQDCKFLCHKKCYTKVVTKCIAKISTDTDPDEAKLNHRIPHRFEPCSNRGTNWCCHCGYILPWSKQKVRKCSECGIMCHTQCVHLVPDFCGMSMEMANKILKTIQDAERNKDEKKKVHKPHKHVSPHKPQNKASSPTKHTSLFLEKDGSTNPTKMSSVGAGMGSSQSQEYPQTEYRTSAQASPSKIDNTTDKLNHFIEENEVYLNFTRGAERDEQSPELEGYNKTLDPGAPMEERTKQGPHQGDLNLDDYNSYEIDEETENQYKDENRLFEEQRHQLEEELQQQKIDEYEKRRREMEVSNEHVPLETTTAEHVHETYEQEPIHTTTTPDYSNPFRDVNNEHYQQDVQPDLRHDVEEESISENPRYSIAASPQKSHSRSESRHKRKAGKRRKVSLDNFILLKVLGKGNFGKVILSKSKNTGRLCAIKVLKKDNIIQNHDIESARAEKKVFLLATKTKHPFLTNLFCSFQTENRIYFAMEFIGGGDLMWHVQNQRLSVRRAKFYAAEVLLALKYFHDNGVIYRDLKLENILLTPQGHIKIADYGLCKDEMWYGNKTSTFCGTPEFMAPEILKDQEYSRAVDWWAFGVLLYQMLLCQSPFSGDDEDEVFNAILTDEPLYPIDMAGDIVQIFQGLLTKDPQNRLGGGPRDALEVMEEPFFRNINFDDVLHLRVEPPYIPEIKSAEDTSYFEQEFTSAPPSLTPLPSVLTTHQQEEFRGFSFMPENLEL